MRVLVTDGGYGNALAITRSLGKKGFYVSVLDSNPRAISLYSKYCRELILSPPITDDRAYEHFLLNLVSTRQYDLLIPVSTGATLIAARNAVLLMKSTCLVLSPYEQIVNAMNKKFVYSLCGSLGVPAPQTIYCDSVGELENREIPFKYPVVVKGPRQTWFGHAVEYVDSRDELLEAFKKMSGELGEPPMIQEYVEGEGYGFFALYDSGVCKRIFMHKRIREYPPSGGVSSCAESFYDSTLMHYGKKILDALKWHGVAMVEFKKPRDRDYKIMEINPRIWGSLDLAIESGCDFPLLLAQIARGEDLDYLVQYERNIRFQWILTKEMMHLMKSPASLRDIVVDVFSRRTKSDIQMSDLLPNLIQLRDLALIFAKIIYRKLRNAFQ